MSQETNCPYCQAEFSIPVAEGDTSSVHVQCSNCRGVFEFMPDFGSFSLPDQGRGFAPSRRFGGSTRKQEFVISGDDVPQSGSGAACCCVVTMILLSLFLPIILEFVFGWG